MLSSEVKKALIKNRWKEPLVVGKKKPPLSYHEVGGCLHLQPLLHMPLLKPFNGRENMQPELFLALTHGRNISLT